MLCPSTDTHVMTTTVLKMGNDRNRSLSDGIIYRSAEVGDNVLVAQGRFVTPIGTS